MRAIAPPPSQSEVATGGSRSSSHPVSQLAQAAGLSCAETPPDGVNEDYDFPAPFHTEGLQDVNLNPILITASFGHFIPPRLLRNFSAHGRGRTLNVHPSFLPKLRSGAPIPWSIVRNRDHPQCPLRDAFPGGEISPLKSWVQLAQNGVATGKSEVPAYGVTVQELSPDGFDQGAILNQEYLVGGDSLVRVLSLPESVPEQSLDDQRQRVLHNERQRVFADTQVRVLLPPAQSSHDVNNMLHAPFSSSIRERGLTAYERWSYRSALLVLAHQGGRALVTTLRDLPGFVKRSASQSQIAQELGCLPTNAFKRKGLHLTLDCTKYDAVHFEALVRAWGYHHTATTTLYTAELVYPLERKGDARKNPVPGVKSVPFSMAQVDVVRTSEMAPEVIHTLQKALMFSNPVMYDVAPRLQLSKDCVNVTRVRPAEPGDTVLVPDIAPSFTMPSSIIPPDQVHSDDPNKWMPRVIELEAVPGEQAKPILTQCKVDTKALYDQEQDRLHQQLTEEKKRSAALDAQLAQAQQQGAATADELQQLKSSIKKQKNFMVSQRKKQQEQRHRPAFVIKCAPSPVGSSTEFDEAFLVVRQYRIGQGRKWRIVTNDTWNGLWERADELGRLNLRSEEPALYQVLLKARQDELARRQQERAQAKAKV